MSQSLFELLEAQAAEVAQQGYTELRQANQSVRLPDPLNLARARQIMREEAALTDDRQIIHPITPDW